MHKSANESQLAAMVGFEFIESRIGLVFAVFACLHLSL